LYISFFEEDEKSLFYTLFGRSGVLSSRIMADGLE